MTKKRGLILSFRLFLRRLEGFFLAPYRHESKSIKASLRILLGILLLCQAALLLAGIPAALTTPLFVNFLFIAGFFSFFPLLLWLLRRGHRNLVVHLFALVVTVLVCLPYLVAEQVGFELHRQEQLAVQVLLQLVLLAAVSERPSSVLMALGIFLISLSVLVFSLQWPRAGSGQTLLLVNYGRNLVNIGLAAGILLFLQRAFHRAVREVEAANRNLEARVIQRTEQLLTAQKSLVEGERLAVLGRLSASVAHEINTPLGAIQSSNQTIRAQLPEVLGRAVSLFRHLTAEQEEILVDLMDQALSSPVLEGLERRRLRKALVQTLEGLGCPDPQTTGEHLVDAGVTDVPDAWKPLLSGPDSAEVGQFLSDFSAVLRAGTIVDGATQKASQFIVALRQFLLDQSALEPEVRADVVPGLEAVVTLLSNQAPPGVRIVKSLEPGLAVLGKSSRLMQVWSHLILRAFEAMKDGGTLSLSARRNEEDLVVIVADTGPEVRPAEATDKPFGMDAGMGLSLVRDILTEHDGQLSCESGPDSTRFIVRLPLAKANDIDQTPGVPE